MGAARAPVRAGFFESELEFEKDPLVCFFLIRATHIVCSVVSESCGPRYSDRYIVPPRAAFRRRPWWVLLSYYTPRDNLLQELWERERHAREAHEVFSHACKNHQTSSGSRKHVVICDRLRALREEKKLSQGDIEKRTGLLRCYFSHVENGPRFPQWRRWRRWRGRSLPLEFAETAGTGARAGQKAAAVFRSETAVEEERAKVYSRLNVSCSNAEKRGSRAVLHSR